MKAKYLFLLFGCALLLMAGIGKWGLTETSEARYAQISKEMYERNDYLHPHLLGIKHYHKPPVTYYITCLGYSFFGVNEVGARFFLQVAFLFQLMLVFAVSKLLYKDEKKAWLSSLLFFSTTAVLIAVRNLTTDAYLLTFIMAAIYFWLLARQRNKVFILLYYTFLALGFLTKGPLVFIPVWAFISIWKILNKPNRKFSFIDVAGLFLFGIISFSWFIAILVEDTSLLSYFIDNQIANRITAKNAFHRGQPFWFYLLVVPLAGLPWLPFVTALLFKNAKKIIFSRPIDRVLAITVIVILGLFSLFSTKLILYVLPVYFFMSLLGGNLIYEASEKQLKLFYYSCIGYAILLVGMGIYINIYNNEFSINPYLLAVSGIILLVTLIYLHKNYVAGYYKGICIIFSITVSLLLCSPYLLRDNEEKINSIKPIAAFINTIPSKNIYVYNYLLPSLSFYQNKPIVTLHNGHNTTHRETQFQYSYNYREYFYNLEDTTEVKRLWEAFNYMGKNVLVIRNKDKIPSNLSFMLSQLRHKKIFKKWTVYYE